MSRALSVCVVVGLLVIPAAAEADPIPVNGIVEQNGDFGASVRLDRGSSYSGVRMAGNMSGSASRDDDSTSARGLLYAAPSARSGNRVASTSGEPTAGEAAVEAATVLAAGPYLAAPVVVAPMVITPVMVVAPPAAEVAQAFREAFGELTAAEIDAAELAPVLGAMGATDVMAVGDGGPVATLIDPTGPAGLHASEPATLILIGSGLLALARRERTKRSRRGVSHP